MKRLLVPLLAVATSQLMLSAAAQSESSPTQDNSSYCEAVEEYLVNEVCIEESQPVVEGNIPIPATCDTPPPRVARVADAGLGTQPIPLATPRPVPIKKPHPILRKVRAVCSFCQPIVSVAVGVLTILLLLL